MNFCTDGRHAERKKMATLAVLALLVVDATLALHTTAVRRPLASHSRAGRLVAKESDLLLVAAVGVLSSGIYFGGAASVAQAATPPAIQATALLAGAESDSDSVRRAMREADEAAKADALAADALREAKLKLKVAERLAELADEIAAELGAEQQAATLAEEKAAALAAKKAEAMAMEQETEASRMESERADKRRKKTLRAADEYRIAALAAERKAERLEKERRQYNALGADGKPVQFAAEIRKQERLRVKEAAASNAMTPEERREAIKLAAEMELKEEELEASRRAYVEDARRQVKLEAAEAQRAIAARAAAKLEEINARE